MARAGFDDWTKALSTTRTRRAALWLGVAGLVAGGPAAAAARSAGRSHHRCHKLGVGVTCTIPADCCSKQCGASGLAEQPFFCRKKHCLGTGGTCAASADCCQGLCQNSVCFAPGGTP